MFKKKFVQTEATVICLQAKNKVMLLDFCCWVHQGKFVFGYFVQFVAFVFFQLQIMYKK